MQTVVQINFPTVKTEGAILPAELLQQIADQANLPGLRAEDYHLFAGEKLNEAINRAWTRCLGAWQRFVEQQGRLSASDFGTTLTRERWLLVLFQELGYGRLQNAPTFQIEETPYPISHVWGQMPIHLVSFRQDIDRTMAGGGGMGKRQPHSLVQEFLNRSPDHLWGMVSNGLQLRLLRDNISLTRMAYLEFDLEAMFTGQLYADFSLLWLVAHQSRVEVAEGQTLADCWLEQWSKMALEQGARALDALRDGVQEAIQALGRGFLAHKANRQTLHQALRTGALSTQEYYRQLLRLVYRLIFLFAAEERNLLHLPTTPPEVQQLYTDYYSASRLRRFAEFTRGGPHADLYVGLGQLLTLLRQGYAPLGISPLGGFLFSERATPHLDAAQIANQDLLTAVRALTFVIEGQVRRSVDYRNLGAEELGSVYESLLELHPDLDVNAATFSLNSAAGSERKTSGSYYTPTSLINALLDSALEPVVAERLKNAHVILSAAPHVILSEAKNPPSHGSRDSSLPLVAQSDIEGHVILSGAKNPPSRGSKDSSLPLVAQSDMSPQEAALLSIKLVDPACGSGHFLIAAAHRLARHLAIIRSGDEEPTPQAQRAAMREVVANCIYGVDLNEMAVELCKVALWMETLTPGQPLNFLDHHIKHGNSLIGATPELLAEGIPDDAFQPVTGDDSKVAAIVRKRNKAERNNQMKMWQVTAFFETVQDVEQWGSLNRLAQTDPLMAEQTYHRYLADPTYRQQRLVYDLWTAAFFWPLTADTPDIPTQDVFLQAQANSQLLRPTTVAQTEHLAAQHEFFHWSLEFPHVFEEGQVTPNAASHVILSEAKNPSSHGQGDSSLPLVAQSDMKGASAAPKAQRKGGFDVVLGNPPWEMVELSEVEFFTSRLPEIAEASTARQRQAMIKNLASEQPEMFKQFMEAKRSVYCYRKFVQTSNRYPLSSTGRINLYPLFVEAVAHLINDNGYTGVIVPSAISMDAYNAPLFSWLVKENRLKSLLDFENRKGIFPAVDSRYRFCLLTLSIPTLKSILIKFAYMCHDAFELQNPNRLVYLTSDEIRQFSPNTLGPPILQNETDTTVAKKVYRQFGVLFNQQTKYNPWQISIQRMLSLSDEGDIFRKYHELSADDRQNKEQWMRLYSGKALHHYNHRFAMYDDKKWHDVSYEKLQNPISMIETEYYAHAHEVYKRLKDKNPNQWLIGYRDVTNATNERTAIAAIIPVVGCDTTCRNVYSGVDNSTLLSSLLGNINSLVFDYLARQKIIGMHLNASVFYQLPIIPPDRYTPDLLAYIVPRVLELTYTAWDLRPFADDVWREAAAANLQLAILAQWEANRLATNGGHANATPPAWAEHQAEESEAEAQLTMFSTPRPTHVPFPHPPFMWDEERRAQLRADLDGLYGHLYGLTREELAYILETFPIVKRRDEATYGEYRTKRLVLAAYDAWPRGMSL